MKKSEEERKQISNSFEEQLAIDWLKPAEKFDGFENQVISEKPSEVAISVEVKKKKKMVHMVVVVVASKEYKFQTPEENFQK